MAAVKHVVLMQLKPETPEKTVTDLFAELAGLTEVVPGLLNFSGGPYSSPEGLQQGFTHGFVMTFADEASRDGYLPHPAHESVKSQILEHLDGGLEAVVAFDWLE